MMPYLFDKQPIAAGDRVLLDRQDNPAENGVYEVIGGSSSLIYLSATPTPKDGTVVQVLEGARNAGSWVKDGQYWLQLSGTGLSGQSSPVGVDPNDPSLLINILDDLV
jgi:hypothetical protein